MKRPLAKYIVGVLASSEQKFPPFPYEYHTNNYDAPIFTFTQEFQNANGIQ